MLFRKIVSNLSFSPALLNQLGFYAKRLKKEQATRRIGLLFTALALIVQTFAIMNPPEAALATNPNNLIFNGIRSKDDLLNAWDRNTDGHGNNDVQQTFKYFLGSDFSRKDIENTKKGSFGSRDKVNGGRIMSLGRTAQTSDPAQRAHNVRDAKGSTSTIWARHLDAFDSGANRSGRGSIYDGFIGTHNGKWFAIMNDCGNIVFPETNEPPSATPQYSVKATCREVIGHAYDKRNLKSSLKVYLYLDGGPGVGEKLSTVANLATPDDAVNGDHGFKFTVPAKYHTGKTYDYTVVVSAHADYQSVQYKGRINTSSCKTPDPIAQCQSLRITPIPATRNKFTLSATTSVANNAKITGYRYTINDAKNTQVFNRTYPTANLTHSTEEITLEKDGAYSAKVMALTSTGEKTSSDCAQTLTIIPQEKCTLNPSLPANDKKCKPCPGDPAVWAEDAACVPEIIKSKSVKNLTQNINDANNTTARPGDRIQYNLYVENSGKAATTLALEENLADVLEYATLTDFGGQDKSFTFDKTTQILNWKDLKLNAGQKVTKSVVVEVKQNIPATPKSVGNLESYDCKMGNVFGASSVTVKVQCPEEKIVENTVQQLPQTGTGSNIIFGVGLIVVVTYFYMRSRQMNKEVKLIRKEFNYGTI